MEKLGAGGVILLWRNFNRVVVVVFRSSHDGYNCGLLSKVAKSITKAAHGGGIGKETSLP